MKSGFFGGEGLQKAILKKTAAMARGAQRALKIAGLAVQRESQKIVPVLTGNLKNSAFTRAKGSGFETEVLVGYTASYAIFVHERLDLRHKPGKSAKFLEGPATRLWPELREMIMEEILEAGKEGK